MPDRPRALYSRALLRRLKEWIGTHHTIYPRIPPQGIYFESLVERSFLHTGWPRDQVVLENPNSPKADIKIGDVRLSLKTETGGITCRQLISITKLCTTETGEWTSTPLIRHVVAHLARYDGILMLRAIWEGDAIDYQLVDIPIELLRRMELCEAKLVGRRQGRQSLGFDVMENDQILFHVHFDGADGKCQIRKLQIDRCNMLVEWKQPIVD